MKSHQRLGQTRGHFLNQKALDGHRGPLTAETRGDLAARRVHRFLVHEIENDATEIALVGDF